MTEYSLGDLSIHNEAGKQESADVQARVIEKFIEVLERHLPEGGNVAESIPLSTSWRIKVVFSTRETDTDDYRKNVKRAFPGAEVTTLAQGGDSWNVPYQSGIHVSHSKSGTFVLVLMFCCLLWGLYFFFSDKL
jgi:hypothetical protein